MNHNFRRLFGVTALIAATATPAVADDFILSIGHDATSSAGSTVLVETGDRFFIDLGAARSYSCEAIPTDALTEFDWSDQVAAPPALPRRSLHARPERSCLRSVVKRGATMITGSPLRQRLPIASC